MHVVISFTMHMYSGGSEPGPWPGQKCAVMIIIHYSLIIINLHTWLICFFQLFFWRACLSRYALLVLVCMSAFVVV